MTVESTDIAPATGDYSVDRMRHVRAFEARASGEEHKLEWPLQRLHAMRDARLRALLRVARERSPWHARRLRDVDPDRISGKDLSQIPPMTKQDLRENWDEIVTDRRLTLELANRHLERVIETGPAYLLDQYHVVASSGSTGQRTVFAFDFNGWLEAGLVVARHQAAISGLLGGTLGRVAVVAAPNAIHESGALFRTFGIEAVAFRAIPSTLPIADIVDGLNAFRPDAIQTYPSVLEELSREAGAGRLRISPRLIMCGGEPLLNGIRHTAEAVFHAPLVDVYASTEGFWMAVSYPGGGAALHLVEDNAVYEPVDTHDEPVPPGAQGDRILLTNVVNQVLPLIRYEMTDRVRMLDEVNPGPWTGRRIAPVEGRVEQVFTYPGGVVVNPELFDAALDSVPAVRESQILQTNRGATIRVRADSDTDLPRLQAELEYSLRRSGVEDPTVSVERVDSLVQSAGSGKLNRFVRLPVQGVPINGAQRQK